MCMASNQHSQAIGSVQAPAIRFLPPIWSYFHAPGPGVSALHHLSNLLSKQMTSAGSWACAAVSISHQPRRAKGAPYCRKRPSCWKCTQYGP